MSDKTKHIQTEIPEELHRKAKMEASRTGRFLQDIMAELVNLWLDGKIKLEEEGDPISIPPIKSKGAYNERAIERNP